MTEESKKKTVSTTADKPPSEAIRRYIREVDLTKEKIESDLISRRFRELISKAHIAGDLGDKYWLSTVERDTETLQRAAELEAEIKRLRRSLEEQAKAFSEAQFQDTSREAELRAKLDELEKKQRLDFLLSRVNLRAQQLLLESDEFRNRFLEQKECESFVVSVDIRRSTELMLKARAPEKFAEFITELCTKFARIITDNFGVFDKFTGDGVLAFFPEFYAGEDAALLVVKTAIECHQAFHDHYREKRSSFSSILTDVGLGIGIDFGKTHLVQMAGGLTVVGVPVVYACRLSGAPAGCTYFNQPAFERIGVRVSSEFSFEETELDIKHEGGVLAYSVKATGRLISPRAPAWTERSS